MNEIPEDYYLKYPNEGNTGGDLLNVVYDEVKQLKAENERYIAALKEQMELVEYAFVAGRSKGYSWVQFQEDHKSAIENAKKLTDGKGTD